MEDLKREIAIAISNWKDSYTNQIEIDDETEYEIYRTTERYVKRIDEQLDDLESEIDSLVEQMNEPSDYEYDMREYDRLRTRELIGG